MLANKFGLLVVRDDGISLPTSEEPTRVFKAIVSTSTWMLKPWFCSLGSPSNIYDFDNIQQYVSIIIVLKVVTN